MPSNEVSRFHIQTAEYGPEERQNGLMQQPSLAKLVRRTECLGQNNYYGRISGVLMHA
jgi:hypothetical protein